MRDAEEGREAAGVRTFSDAGASEKHPLDIPGLGAESGEFGYDGVGCVGA